MQQIQMLALRGAPLWLKKWPVLITRIGVLTSIHVWLTKYIAIFQKNDELVEMYEPMPSFNVAFEALYHTLKYKNCRLQLIVFNSGTHYSITLYICCCCPVAHFWLPLCVAVLSVHPGWTPHQQVSIQPGGPAAPVPGGGVWSTCQQPSTNQTACMSLNPLLL